MLNPCGGEKRHGKAPHFVVLFLKKKEEKEGLKWKAVEIKIRVYKKDGKWCVVSRRLICVVHTVYKHAEGGEGVEVFPPIPSFSPPFPLLFPSFSP